MSSAEPSAPPAPAPAPRSRRRRSSPAEEPCECEHGGRCVRTGGSRACACAGPWGGPRCALYVGHDHACSARACAPPALCVWPRAGAGGVRCACPEGAACALGAAPPPAPAPAAPASPALGAWAGALLTLLLLVLVALGALRRRRARSWAHSRLLDDLEISNPVYLAAEDEPPAAAAAAGAVRTRSARSLALAVRALSD